LRNGNWVTVGVTGDVAWPVEAMTVRFRGVDLVLIRRLRIPTATLATSIR